MKKQKIKPIKALMTPFPYSIEITDHVANAKKLMQDHNFRHLPVTKNSELVGIVSDRDLQWVISMVASNRIGQEEDIEISEIYHRDIFTVDLNERSDNVMESMAEQHIGSAIVTKDGKLAGIFTATDACKHFVAHLREEFHPPEDGILA